MKPKQHNDISESQVEDALVADLFYLGKILQISADIKLIARQLRLKEGEECLDLLLASGKDLCLVELKVTEFYDDCIDQILSYKTELINLQNSEKLISGNIRLFLLVTGANKKQISLAKQNDIKLVVYEPLAILRNYYENLSAIAPFLKIKPNDYGVFSLGLINRALIQVAKGVTKQEEIATQVNLSKQSIHNHLKVAKEFGLVREREKNYFLTDIGDNYIENCNRDALIDRLSTKQIEILKQFIANDPFYSSTVFGIYAIVESAFLLSRNAYPLELEELRKIFQKVAGKIREWQAQKSLSTATYTFLNFAIGLELLGKIGQSIVITPAGFKFILMLQLHKSIEMIESLTNNSTQKL